MNPRATKALRRLRSGAASLLWFSSAMAIADQTVQVGPGLVFSPATATVSPGEAVIWNFADPFMPHSTTSDATTGPEVWDSGQLTSGSFSHTFNTPGTYEYYCSVHSGPTLTLMNGVVVVLGGATATPTPTAPAATATPTATAPAPTATLTATVSGPTATATVTPPLPSVTPTSPAGASPTPTSPLGASPTPTATSIATPPGGVPTTTPIAPGAPVPGLDAWGRTATVLALALAGVAILFLSRRH